LTRSTPGPHAKSRAKINRVGWVALVTVLFAGTIVFADYWRTIPEDVVASYVGRDSCATCHAKETAAYVDSHHDKAMDLATDATVLGDFNNATLDHDGMISRMFRDGKRFMVHTDGPTGKMEDFEVKYVFGVDPLQNYMVEFDRDENTLPGELARVQVLRISWDTKNKKWFYIRPPDVKEKLLPDDPLHWTGLAQRWQTMCADCHSTNLKTNFDVQTTSYHTTFSEIDVSCEACHGPASTHVEMANSVGLFWDRKIGYGLNKLKTESNKPQIETCAPCHSRRGLMQPGFTGGPNYHDYYQLELLQPETYYDDGQIKDEVYVFGSFTQSRMYHKNIRCTDCHDPHSLQLKHPGNETCTSCHQHPAGKYDVPAHHRHAVNSEGAKCVNCHMPGRTYMDVDFRRDHSLRVPRPDLSVEFQTPNACTDCHIKDQLEKVPSEKRESLREYADWLAARDAGDATIGGLLAETDKWCDDACEKWYGEERKTPEHYGQTIASFRRGDPGSVEKMLNLAMQKDDTTPAIVRATAFDNLASSGATGCSVSAMRAMEDTTDHPRVRAAAVRCFASESPSQVRRALIPRLNDDSRLVRTEAAQMLASPQVYESLTSNERTRVDLALREVEQSIAAVGDRAGAHMSWAGLCEQRQMIPEAIKAYETAIRVEPTVSGARTNLAALLEQLAGRGDARAAMRAKTLRAAELPLLGRDSKLAPDNAPLQYRYGLALYLAGDLPAAMQQLKRAAELAPDVEDFRVAVELLQEKMAE